MKKLKTTKCCVALQKNGLPAGTVRLAFLTDMHACCSQEEIKAVFSILDAERPAGVLVGGDMIFAKPGWSIEAPLQFLCALSARYPVWCGTGNHEYRTRIYPEEYGSMYADYVGALKSAGATVLENATAEVMLSGLPLAITGFDMDRRYYRRFRKHPPIPQEEMTAAIGRPAPERVSILLAHDAGQLESYFSWGADLTLCGHYHGGIVRFGKHTGLVSPNLTPFPRCAYGRFERDGHTVFVGAGLGEHHIRLRVNNPREVVIVDLCVNGAHPQESF